MSNSSDIVAMAHAAAAIVQQQGQFDFPGFIAGEDVRTATLCGLTVYIENGQVMRLKSRDLDIRLESGASFSFLQGTLVELERWHSRLVRFQTVFRYAAPAVLKESAAV